MLCSSSLPLDCWMLPELASGHGKHMHGKVVLFSLLPGHILQPIAQWVELLVFIHPLNFFWTVWFTLLTPLFDSECLGEPLTIWHSGHRFFSSLMKRSMNSSSNTILCQTWLRVCPENSPLLSVWRILGGPCLVKIVNSAKATVVALFATMGMEVNFLIPWSM